MARTGRATATATTVARAARAAQTGRAIATLARWLGPWSPASVRPRGVARRTVAVDGPRPFDAWWYTPRDRAPLGAYLVAPGLHYAGPADPRFDRLCAVLAAAGFAVLAPFLPDYLALRVRPTAIDDLARAFDLLASLPERPARVRPGVFSISFGSLPALRLAASERHADAVGGLIVFGGFADFARTIEFCLTGRVGGRAIAHRDPLNQPVVVLNLLDWVADPPRDRAALVAAWRAYVEATWGRPEMKRDGAYQRVARRFEPDAPPQTRRWYRIGVGLDPGADELCRAALARLDDRAAFLDPRPHLAGIRCPVHIVHGRDDDVIPYTEALALADAMPRHVDCRVHLTGLYGHTQATESRWSPSRAPAVARELATMARILRAIVACGTRAT